MSSDVITINGTPVTTTIGVAGPQGPPGPAVAPGTAGQFYVTNAAATAPIWVNLSGDGTGSGSSPGAATVIGWRGKTIDNATFTAPSDAFFPVYSSAGTKWVAVAMSGDVTISASGVATVAASAKGITQLTGDVTAGPGSGSQAATVAKVNGATVPAAGALTTGNGLYVSGASALTYSALNLAGGSNYVTGLLPISNIAPGTAGQVFVSNATPNAAWTSLISYETTHGRFQSGSGSDYIVIIGPKSGNETSLAAIYILPNATSPNSSNYAIYGDGANQYVTNTPGANPTFFWQAAGTTVAKWDFTTSTTPILQVGTAATSFTVGTAKTGSALNLQSGNAITSLSLTNPGGGSLVAAITQGQHFAHQVSKGTNYTIDSSGAGDEQIWMTAACTITLPNPASASGRCIEIIVNYDPAVGGGTIARNGAELINGAASNITLATGDKYTVLLVRSNGTDWVIGKATAAP